jgi:glyoxylase-like metal-dependent hydrolase (beta-lactamase superfamily II)
MIIDQPGHVTDRIILLGRKESCIYLLDGGDEYAILGGGFAYIAGDVMDQLDRFEIDPKKIKRILILHSHFDHCGIVPWLKSKWPWAEVAASERARVMLARPKVIENIKSLNRMMLQEHGEEDKNVAQFLDTFHIDIENVLEDQALLSCGDRSMVAIMVPGHSSCSIAVYVPEEKAMFSSDAAGIPFGNGVLTAANSNYDHYMTSLEKIFTYDIQVILAEHYGARTHADCRKFIRESAASAIETRELLEESWARTKDVRQSVQEITRKMMEWAPDDSFSGAVISLVVGQMMNYISRIRSNE